MSDWTPDPQEKGWLEPPKRRPPTAVGVATPPPPHRRGGRYPRESRIRHFALATGGFSLALAAGIATGALAPAAISVAVIGGLAGYAVFRRISNAIARRRWRASRAHAQRAA
jgi:hypothetical protein